MKYRLLQSAEDEIDLILLKSASMWGLDAAGRYSGLMVAVFNALGADPMLRGSRAVHNVSGLRSFHLRLGSRLVETGQRVAQPRHIVVYRVGPDGMVEIMGLAHDRMLLGAAADAMWRANPGSS